MIPVYLHLWFFDAPESVFLDWTGREHLVPGDLFKGSLLLDTVRQPGGVELIRALVHEPHASDHWHSLAAWCFAQGLIDHAVEFHAIAAVAEQFVAVEMTRRSPSPTICSFPPVLEERR